MNEPWTNVDAIVPLAPDAEPDDGAPSPYALATAAAR